MKNLIMYTFFLASFAVMGAFSLENTIVPKEAILSGGPPKDGIPAILKPEFIHPGQASFLDPDDSIIGIDLAGEVRAYPIKILNWHEVVNDTINGVPIVVTF